MKPRSTWPLLAKKAEDALGKRRQELQAAIQATQKHLATRQRLLGMIGHGSAVGDCEGRLHHVPIGQAPQAIAYVPNAAPNPDDRQNLQALGVAGQVAHLSLSSKDGAKDGKAHARGTRRSAPIEAPRARRRSSRVH